MLEILLTGVIALVIWRICITGTYYIEYDGRGHYFVWQRDFAGFDGIKYTGSSEEGAHKAIAELKLNPPRIIR